jgi:hypothetical protein
MPRINSANPDFPIVEVPSEKPTYTHGLASRKSFIPLAFQVTSPFNTRRVLLPHALVMHVNPSNYNEQHAKKIERIQTRGGFVEQHWGDDLTEVTAEGSTGAFMNIYTGLTSLLRQRTIAWDRYRDLLDLYRNNGSLHDPYGNIVLQGNIMMMYDRGTYIGYFRTFSVEETDDQPFAFRISWSFKVQEEIMKLPNLISNPAARGMYKTGTAPPFQSQNALQSANGIQGTTETAIGQLNSVQQDAFNQRVNAVMTNAVSSNQGAPVNPNAVSAANQGIQEAQAHFNQGNVTQAFQTLQRTNQQVTNILRGQ